MSASSQSSGAMLGRLLPLFVIFVAPTLLPECTALRLLQLSVPRFASLGQPVAMGCQFDTGNAKLYSVKWYKDGAEFCRFMPGYQPQSQLFTAPGIRMEESGCRMTSVSLRAASLDTTGAYRCEVSTESPNFETVFHTQNLTVRALPSDPPHISGMRYSYVPGDSVKVTCTAKPSLPAATLQWLLNGQPVDQSLVTGSMGRSHLSGDDEEEEEEGDGIFADDDDDVEAEDKARDGPKLGVSVVPGAEGDDAAHLLESRTTLSFTARPEHFSGPARELTLRCEARLHELSWRVERRAVLGGPGGKQHLARHEEPRSSLAGVTAPHLLLVLLLRTAAILMS